MSKMSEAERSWSDRNAKRRVKMCWEAERMQLPVQSVLGDLGGKSRRTPRAVGHHGNV